MVGNTQFQDFFLFLMTLEGGFSDHPLDKGGRTNYGITQGLLDRLDYIDVEDVKDLTMKEAEEIYFKEFYTPVKNLIDKSKGRLDGKATFHVFDICVNSGYGAARNLLKDYENGRGTIAEIRKNFYTQIVKANPSQKVFIKGWFNRVDRIEKEFGNEQKS